MLDSFVLTQPSLYISSLLLALRSMLQMDLPHLNVLTKIDSLHKYPPLPFNLDYYTEVQDLDYLLPHLDHERSGAPPSSTEADEQHLDHDADVQDATDQPTHKFHALNRALVDLITDFGLLAFHTLAVEDKQSMLTLLRAIDRASGFAFSGGDPAGANDTVWAVAMREGNMVMDARDVQERWIDRREEFDEIERREWEAEATEWQEGGNDLGNDAGLSGTGNGMGSGVGATPDGGIKIVRKKKTESDAEAGNG